MLSRVIARAVVDRMEQEPAPRHGRRLPPLPEDVIAAILYEDADPEQPDNLPPPRLGALRPLPGLPDDDLSDILI